MMDATAISLCMDNKLPIVVFNLRTPGNHAAASIMGEPVGIDSSTVVTALDGVRRMDVNDLKGCSPKSSKRMDGALEHVRHELAGVRTGRASVTILDTVHVEAYGSQMPLNQVAVAVDPRADADRRAAVRPVAASAAIEKAIRSADLGLNPANDGKVVRIPIPALTEERRKELSQLRAQATPRKAATASARSAATPTTG